MITLLVSESNSFVDAPCTFFLKNVFLPRIFNSLLNTNSFCWFLKYVHIFSNENNKSRIIHRTDWNNTHLVDSFWSQSIRNLPGSWFQLSGIGLYWYWFGTKYQNLGTSHAHGYLRLKLNRRISKIANDVLKGKMAEHHLSKIFIDFDWHICYICI